MLLIVYGMRIVYLFIRSCSIECSTFLLFFFDVHNCHLYLKTDLLLSHHKKIARSEKVNPGYACEDKILFTAVPADVSRGNGYQKFVAVPEQISLWKILFSSVTDL